MFRLGDARWVDGGMLLAVVAHLNSNLTSIMSLWLRQSEVQGESRSTPGETPFGTPFAGDGSFDALPPPS